MNGRIRPIAGTKLVRLALASTLAGLTLACSPDLDFDAATWAPAPPRPANEVVHRQAALHLGAAAEPLAQRRELARLDAFLRQAAPSAAAWAELRASGAPGLTEAVIARLRAAGIPPAHIRHLPAEPDAPPGLALRLDDVAVQVPRCSADAQGDVGCATARALGLMVADPRDLARGEASGPPAADLPAAAVMRQRRDEVKPLPADRGRMAP